MMLQLISYSVLPGTCMIIINNKIHCIATAVKVAVKLLGQPFLLYPVLGRSYLVWYHTCIIDNST